jgi:hypothetical protein
MDNNNVATAETTTPVVAEVTQTTPSAEAVKPALMERVKTEWAKAVLQGKQFAARLVPSYKTLAVAGTLAFLLLTATAVMNGVAAQDRIVKATTAAQDKIVTATVAAQSRIAAEAEKKAPTLGQRLYAAGQVVHGYTIQPCVNADGAVRSSVFGEATATAVAPSSMTITVK